jgi:hypothetical protein
MKAFPCNPDMKNSDFDGMDLRDYFAAKALPVIFEMIAFNHKKSSSDFEWEFDEEDFKSLANMAYDAADSMMKAREQ